jgi:leader peptidase (prepilin peptidase) / N-methyltransferase
MNLTILISFFVFIFGLIIGSFLNVLIYRIPLKLDFVKGRSFCPSCHHELGAFDLFPVFSYVFLKGQCRYCHEKISLRYPLIELLTGILFTLVYLRFGPSITSVIGILLTSTLIVLSMIDLDTMEFNDGFSIFILILGAISMAIFLPNPMTTIFGMFVISLPMYAIAALTGGFGGADIKLMGAAGLLLGFPNIIVAFFIGVLTGGIQAVVLLKKGNDKKSMMPFGAHLALGIYLAFLVGKPLLDWYLGFFKF